MLQESEQAAFFFAASKSLIAMICLNFYRSRRTMNSRAARGSTVKTAGVSDRKARVSGILCSGACGIRQGDRQHLLREPGLSDKRSRLYHQPGLPKARVRGGKPLSPRHLGRRFTGYTRYVIPAIHAHGDCLRNRVSVGRRISAVQKRSHQKRTSKGQIRFGKSCLTFLQSR